MTTSKKTALLLTPLVASMLTLGGAGSLLLARPAMAQTASPAPWSELLNWVQRKTQKNTTAARPSSSLVSFVPPAGTLPANREGGASRGGLCPVGSKRLTALVPKSNLGLTIAARPSFMFYVPPTQSQEMVFTLTDSRGVEIFEKSLTPSGVGVMRVDMPQNLSGLEVGKNYAWSVVVRCNPNDPSGDLYAAGWVQRVAPSAELRSDLARIEPGDRPYIYASAGLWYETLSSLAELRQANPTSEALKQDWVNLLQSADLTKVAEEPLVR